MKDKKVGSVLKTETKVIAYIVICLVIIVLGVSYALFFEVKGNEKNQIVKAGTLEFSYAKGSQINNDTNSDCFIPMSSEEALSHSECEYKISITNTGTLPGNYNIKLNSESVENPLALNKLKVILKKEGQVESGYPKEGTTTSLVENEKIEAGKVINYSVQIYADKELITTEDDEKNISIKINGDAVVNSEEINPPMTAIDYIKKIANENTDDLTYDGKQLLGELGTNDNNLRYIGANPNNYILFNNEKWRIIGIMKVKVSNSKTEERLKIIRTNGIEGQNDNQQYLWDNNNNNDWTTSSLMRMLNGIYYESQSGDCFKNQSGEEASQCDFTSTSSLPGINEIARNMIDKEIIWNLGGLPNQSYNAAKFYQFERDINVVENHQTEWNKSNGGNFYNGVGLMYPSDYGYAIEKNMSDTCLKKFLSDYNIYNCNLNNWLTPKSDNYWTITPLSNNFPFVFNIHTEGFVNNNGAFSIPRIALPVVYLKSTTKILSNPHSELEYGTIDNPFILK